jgi:hypothetical protein
MLPVSGGHSHGSGSDGAHSHAEDSRRPKFRKWRIPILLLAVVVLTMIGFKFKALATPGRESANLLLNPPLIVDPFADSPNVEVHLTFVINPPLSCVSAGAGANCQSDSGAGLFATLGEQNSSASVNPDSKIVILSNKPGRPYSDFLPAYGGVQSTKDATYSSTRSDFVGYQYSLTVDAKTIEHNQWLSPYGAPIAEFNLPSVTQEVNGSFFAHLPQIGASYSEKCTIVAYSPSCDAFGPSSSIEFSPALYAIISAYPSFLTEATQLHGRDINDMIFAPNPTEHVAKLFATEGDVPNANDLKLLRNVSSYLTIPGSRDDLYWQAAIQATEVLTGAKSILAGSSIDSVLPPDGNLEGDSYVWEGAGLLEPTLTATNMNATESQGNYDFLSGIFFATAAAAAIAFIQELPEAIPLPNWWPRWRIRKPSSPSSAQHVNSGLGWPE